MPRARTTLQLATLLVTVVCGCHRWLPSIPPNAGARGGKDVCASFAHEPDVFVACGLEVGRALADRRNHRDAFDIVDEVATHDPTGTRRASASALREARDQLEAWAPYVWADVERLVREGRGDLALRRAAVICSAFSGPGARMNDIRDAPPARCPFAERLETLRSALFAHHERLARRALEDAPGAAAIHACWVAPDSTLCRDAGRRHRRRTLLADVELTVEASKECWPVANAIAGVYGERVALPIRSVRVVVELTQCAVEDSVTRSEGTCYHPPGSTQGSEHHDPQWYATPATRIHTLRTLPLRGRIRTATGLGPLSARKPLQLAASMQGHKLRADACVASSGYLPQEGVSTEVWRSLTAELRHRLSTHIDRNVTKEERQRHLDTRRASTDRGRPTELTELFAVEDRLAIALADFPSPHAYGVPQSTTHAFVERYGFMAGAARYGTPRVDGVGRVLAFVWLVDRSFRGGAIEGLP